MPFEIVSTGILFLVAYIRVHAESVLGTADAVRRTVILILFFEGRPLALRDVC
jgi:hypothetical protein